MGSFRKLLLILTVLLILPAGLYAQTGSYDPEQVFSNPANSEAEGFRVAVDLRLGGTAANFIPGLSAVVGVPMQLSSDSVSLVPLVGFLYFFDVWTDIHSTYYIPVGIEAVYNPYNLKLKVLYYPPVGTADGIHLLSATGGAELALFDTGGFSMRFDIGLGPMFVFDPAGTAVLFSINSSLIMRYMI